MLPLLLDAVFGGLAGLTGYWVARRAAPANPRRNQIIFLVVTILGFQLASQLIGPQVVRWNQRREIDQFLNTDPLFKRITTDHPEAGVSLRGAMEKAYLAGKRQDAVAATQAVLAKVFPHYIMFASEESLLIFARRLVDTLKALESRDPERCYQYLFPKPGEVVVVGKEEGKAELYASISALVQSASGSAIEIDEAAANEILDGVVERLRKRHGERLSILGKAGEADVDRAAMCSMSIGLYSEVLALQSAEAGLVLRILLNGQRI